MLVHQNETRRFWNPAFFLQAEVIARIVGHSIVLAKQVAVEAVVIAGSPKTSRPEIEDAAICRAMPCFARLNVRIQQAVRGSRNSNLKCRQRIVPSEEIGV